MRVLFSWLYHNIFDSYAISQNFIIIRSRNIFHNCAGTLFRLFSFSIITIRYNKWYIFSKTLKILTFSRIYHVFSYSCCMLLDTLYVSRFSRMNYRAIDLSPCVPVSLPPRIQASQTNYRNLLNFFYTPPRSRIDNSITRLILMNIHAFVPFSRFEKKCF